MSDEDQGGNPGKVVWLENFRRSTSCMERRKGCVHVSEDDTGDVDYEMDGITPLNALPLLVPLLYLSGRLLAVYMGKT